MVVGDNVDCVWFQVGVLVGVGVWVRVAHEILFSYAFHEKRIALMVGAVGVGVYLAIYVVVQAHRGGAYG